jgi:signal transduction histidine kinase
MALILIYWWGPRILPALFLNATLSAGLWGLSHPILYPLYAFPETLLVFLSWLFFIKMAKGKCWLPNVRHLTYLLLFGILFPLILYKILQEGIFVLTDQIPSESFIPLLVTTSLGDFISIFGFTIPILYFVTDRMQRKGYVKIKDFDVKTDVVKVKRINKRRDKIELGIIGLLVLLFSQTLTFADYWFLYGILSLYSAIRFGFGLSILVNSYILLLTYFFPSVLNEQFTSDMILGQEMTRIQMGTGLLYVFSLITGRVISDAIAYEKQRNNQNRQLEHVNQELDRFVYSVSHDLSAPLKSIRGLVNISRFEQMNERMTEYIDHIELSTDKLESFIIEILDFSRNDRKPLSNEVVDLRKLCLEILESLQFFENFNKIKINTSAIDQTLIYTDEMRIKIILTNLISNAIKYQKQDKEGLITINTAIRNNTLTVVVEDNGEGILPETQERIFDMFYRGTQSSHGSGLGLYITKEVVEKLNGNIQVKSVYGEGSTFTLNVPIKAMVTNSNDHEA